MAPFTRYFWKEIKEDGRLVDPDWANSEGYEHSDQATVHFHYKFSIDLEDHLYPGGPVYTLMKFYGVKK